MVTVRDFTKFHIPPPLSFEFENISRISPYPGAENLIHPLYSPTYSPGWPGVLPLGEADDMCIIISLSANGRNDHPYLALAVFSFSVKLLTENVGIILCYSHLCTNSFQESKRESHVCRKRDFESLISTKRRDQHQCNTIVRQAINLDQSFIFSPLFQYI